MADSEKKRSSKVLTDEPQEEFIDPKGRPSRSQEPPPSSERPSEQEKDR